MNEMNIDFNALIESVSQMYILLLAALFILPVLFAIVAYIILGWVDRRLHRTHQVVDSDIDADIRTKDSTIEQRA
jgi:hypothetical protein